LLGATIWNAPGIFCGRYSHFFVRLQKFLIMGRGDKKTAKGKRFKGSYGKSRPAISPEVKKKLAAKKEEAAK
jgi:30S ribosomal protein S31